MFFKDDAHYVKKCTEVSDQVLKSGLLWVVRQWVI